MKKIYSFCKKGDNLKNEDTFGYRDDYAWVIDGATDVFERKMLGIEHEVSWYVNKLSEELYKRCIHEYELEDLLRIAVNGIAEELNLNKLQNFKEYELPTFAISLIKWNETKLEYLILGDCCLGRLENGTFNILTDQRLTRFSADNREKIKTFIDKNGSFPKNKEIFQDTRSKANASNGYPIGSVLGTGISKAVKGSLKLKHGEKVILFSDGILEYAKNFPKKMYKFFSQDTYREEIEELYEFLKNKKIYNENPRPKKIDDCTILLMEV